MELTAGSVARPSRFPEPATTLDEVDAALRNRVAESRVESTIDEGRVPVVVVPPEITGLAGLRLAMQASINARG